MGLEKQLSGEECLLTLQKTQIQFSASTMQLPTAYISSSRRSDSVFSLLKASVAHDVHTSGIYTHIEIKLN